MNAFIYDPSAKPPFNLANVLPSGPKTVQFGNNQAFPYSSIQGMEWPSGTPLLAVFSVSCFPFFADGAQDFTWGQPAANIPCVVKDTDPWGKPSDPSIKLFGNLNPTTDPNGSLSIKVAITGDSGARGCLTIQAGLEQLSFWFTVA